MTRPLTVTVAITTYNQARFLERTLQSVFAQTRPPDEVVVVDDGSTDSTPELLQRYDARVRVVRQPNGGIARARNRAVREATGDMVALLDGDDLWKPEKLERCLEAARLEPAAVIVNDVETISEDGQQVLVSHPLRDYLLDQVGSPGPVLRQFWENLVKTSFIWTTSQVLVDRQLYLAVGMSNPRFRISSDYDLYLRLAARAKFLVIPEVLTQWRQHATSASGAGADRGLNWTREIVKILRDQAARSGPAASARLREHAARLLDELNCQLYCDEFTRGTWPTALRLFRVATECRAPSSAMLGLAVLCPQRLRHAAALLTGRSVSTTLRDGSERSTP